MKAKNFIPPSKPRNFVVKNQQTSGAGAHKDKKKAQKQGQVKHKGKEFSEAFPYDVDHMTGSQGINLPSAEPSDILDKPYEHYGNYKKWLQDVNRINRALLDDNADYISKPGAKIVSINREQFAIWSERNGNGHIDVRVAKNHSQLQDDFSEAFPYDVDHMTGSQGINLPSAEPSDILDKPYEHYGNYKKWLQDVNRINRALLDDNADYISKPGAKIVSINREQFAIWSERNGNGHIDVRVAKNHSQLQDDFSEDCDQVCEECSRPVCNTVGVREYLERRLSKKIKEHIERLSAEHARPNKSKK